MNILVVDDARDMQLILRRILTLLGHQVTLANHGLEAWELLQRHTFHVVVSDWLMPEMDGPTLCKTIREANFPHYIYIILLTGMSGTQSLIKGMKAGADDFATKPIVREELEVRLRAAQRILDLEHKLEEKNAYLACVNQSLSEAQTRIHSDLERAAILQAGVLPNQRSIGCLNIDWFFQPAQYIGGDTFNYFAINDDQVFFYSIDVSGHGIASALLSMCLQSLLSAASELHCADQMGNQEIERFPALLAEQLNDHLLHRLDIGDHYLTMIMGVIDSRREQLHFVQAGHPQPFLYHPATKKLERLDCTGFPVGLLHGVQYETLTYPFPPNSRFILYSDGLLELHKTTGEALDERILQDCLQQLMDKPMSYIIEQLKAQLDLNTPQAALPDDLSLLMIEFKRDR